MPTDLAHLTDTTTAPSAQLGTPAVSVGARTGIPAVPNHKNELTVHLSTNGITAENGAFSEGNGRSQSRTGMHESGLEAEVQGAPPGPNEGVVPDLLPGQSALPVVEKASLFSAAQDYLRSQGISDPATWAAFRLGLVDDVLRDSFGLRSFSGIGITLPTCDPRAPGTITGLVRVTRAQNQHRYLTAPAGIACPVNLDQGRRVVLCDHPLTTLRLHQVGVADVALVEDATVLPPLSEWLQEREIILVSHRPSGIAAMRSALGEQGRAAQSVVVSMSPTRLSDSVRELLGTAPAEVQAPLPITAKLLHELATYAQGRLDAGEGTALLESLSAANPDLVRAYRIGFLPKAYRSALSGAARQMLKGHRCAQSLVLPALDAAGQIVDLFIITGYAGIPHPIGLMPRPQGLLAPEIIAGQTAVTITDSVLWLFRLFAQGHRDVLLLRGPADAEANAERIVAAGVRQVTLRCYRNAEAITAAQHAEGLLRLAGGSRSSRR